MHDAIEGSNMNIRKVPREVLKTEGYFCINITKQCENEENIGTLYFMNSSYFPTRVRYARFGPRSSTHNLARALRDVW